MRKLLDDFSSAAELTLLQKNFEPHKFSRHMCAAINQQMDVNEAIKELIVKALKGDVNVQTAIRDIIYKGWRTFILPLGPIALMVEIFFYFYK